MANVRGGQTTQKGLHTKEQIQVDNRDGKPRDDLGGAFAGEKNVAGHGTNEKSRKLPRYGSGKTPKR